jgi:small conductance mechanosensitive channel
MQRLEPQFDYWTATIVSFGLRALGALVLWAVGRWLISLGARLLSRALDRQKVDPTLVRYIASLVTITLNIVLLVAILGYFGIETTSFAALLAGVGIAVGAAWGGLLSNFAAGAFLIILRPFKVGDYVQAGGVEGTVREVGLFGSTILAPDNSVVLVGNAKLFGDNVRNFSVNPWRRVELTAQIAHAVAPADAIARLKAALPSIPNVLADPAPDVEILGFNERGTLLAVRPYCHTDHYWQVFFDSNRTIADTFAAAGYPVPEFAWRSRTA